MHGVVIAASRRRLTRVTCVFGGVMVLAALTASARAQEPRAATATGTAPWGAIDVTLVERQRYDALRRAPRDPSARAALGDWLAARGQIRSGAVLLEEARLFGSAPGAIAARLRPLYTWLRDWPSLAALPAPPLSAGEKARAAVLSTRRTNVTGPDTTVVPFGALELGGLGRIPLVLERDTVWAEVDPQEEGVVLPGLARGAGLVELFGADRRGQLGVLREATLGSLQLHNLPMRIDATLGAGRARVGLDVFAALAPTVDVRAGTVTLRRAGRVDEPLGADGIPFLLSFPGVQLALRAGERPVPIASPAGRAALRGKRWTMDLRRGVVWVDAAR